MTNTDEGILYRLRAIAEDETYTWNDWSSDVIREAATRIEELLRDNARVSNWNPIETAPKDCAVLIAWGTVASGAMGYDIVKGRSDGKWESEASGDILPSGGYSAIAWMPLPSLPNA